MPPRTQKDRQIEELWVRVTRLEAGLSVLAAELAAARALRPQGPSWPAAPSGPLPWEYSPGPSPRPLDLVTSVSHGGGPLNFGD